ncbi:putative membrane protein YesL [Pullulanibacillus pueri]|uniref:DUF624 domain-containing protein n=1 Tax=Pullulanibacillus pueri TaxID=1437324 RepID=A0A8J2ZU43_9BACL|nr:YesL family protein [Pullulanibacillus pueri]MBM7681821.1 putative membrane protein YesL [Pullulanibacillus pueri]GGH76220.1 hypothetical protein GCM10007096_06320 [Pullulanibacillus pueri]
MKLNGLMNVIYQGGEWIIKLVYANLLWIFFTIIGLGVFGVMPATVGLFTLLRQWIMGKEIVPAFQTMRETFRKEFFKSNLIGLIFLAIGYMLRMDILYFKSSSHLVFQFFLIIMLCLGLCYFITLLNFFPVYVHFDVKFFDYFKYALLIGVTQLASTIMMVLGSVVLFCLYWYFSGLIPLFCISFICLNLMWFGSRSFKKIELQQKQHSTN